MKTLVTGATGFLGSHLVRVLLREGHKVRILRRSNSSTKMLEGLPVETAVGDVTDPVSVDQAVQGCEAVFHAAGHVSFWEGHREIQKRINVDGTRNVVEACLKNAVKRLVHTSSIAAIGFPQKGRLSDETTVYNWWPYKSSYNDTKYLAEQEVLKGIDRGLDAVIVNPSMIFGPGDLNFNTGAILTQMSRSRIFFYPRGGCCVCHVEDVAEAHLQAYSKGKKGERYILGGQNLTWKEAMTVIAEVLNVPPPRLAAPNAVNLLLGNLLERGSLIVKKEPPYTRVLARSSTMDLYYSSAKAVRELGYRQTPFRESIQKTHDWYMENGYL